jgi:hypothetical protein
VNGVSAWLASLFPDGRTLHAVIECCNRAEHFRKEGSLAKALAAGREGLSLRRTAPPPPSGRPADVTALVSLTVLVEELATELGTEGADERDVVESVTKLRNWQDTLMKFPDLANRESQMVGQTRQRWTIYLEERLEARRRTTRCS